MAAHDGFGVERVSAAGTVGIACKLSPLNVREPPFLASCARCVPPLQDTRADGPG